MKPINRRELMVGAGAVAAAAALPAAAVPVYEHAEYALGFGLAPLKAEGAAIVHLGDLSFFDGMLKVYDGTGWADLDEAMTRTYVAAPDAGEGEA